MRGSLVLMSLALGAKAFAMNTTLIKIVLLAHIASTLFMTGVIWFVQIVHYPLFARVGATSFEAYQSANTHLTTWVVAPLMGIEVVTGLLLLWRPPRAVGIETLWIGLFLLALIWFSTVMVQMRQHIRLKTEFDQGIHNALVLSNWIRTCCWTGRSLLMLFILARTLE